MKDFKVFDLRCGFLDKNCIYFTPGSPKNHGGAKFNNTGGLLTGPPGYYTDKRKQNNAFRVCFRFSLVSGIRTARKYMCTYCRRKIYFRFFGSFSGQILGFHAYPAVYIYSV